MADLDDSIYLGVIIDDELLRYVVWAYYGNHDSSLVRTIDRSYRRFIRRSLRGNQINEEEEEDDED